MTNAFVELQRTLSLAVTDGITRLGAILPQLVFALAALIIGWFVASLLYHVTVRALKILAVDKLIAKTPLHGVLRELGASRGPSEIIGRALFWIAILVTLLIVSELLDIAPLTRALTMVVGYLPSIMAAFVVLILGMLLARVLQVVVTQAVGRIGLGYERAAGKAVQAAVLVIVLLVASQQLGFDLSFLTTNVSIIISCILLTAGLGIALGARPLIENALLLRQVRQHLRPGDTVEAGHLRGTVIEFTSTGVVLQDGGRRLIIPAASLSLQPFVISGHSHSSDAQA